MAQLIEKVTTVEFDDELSRQKYFEKHKHQFDFAQFKTFEDKYYTITWYDIKDKEIDWRKRAERVADLCTKANYSIKNTIEERFDFSNIKRPAPLGIDTIKGIL